MDKITLLFLCLLAAPCFAADYYCDLSLSADGNGTTGNPWQWSQAINSDNVNAGDTVYLREAGGEATLDTDSNANGSSGDQILYTQWIGQTTAQFTSVLFEGSAAPYYEINGVTIDAGSGADGTSWVQAVSENLSGSGGEITIDGNIINSFRSSSYSSGDYYPYYLGNSTQIVSGTMYGIIFSDVDGITLEIKNNTFQHGRRIINITGMCYTSGSVLVEGNTFNRCGEDFISVGDNSGNITIRGNSFGETAQASLYFSPFLWRGYSVGTWTGHEGETITQDDTNSTAIFIGVFNDDLYVIANDSNNIPSRANRDVWRLDSDPTNIYWIAGRVINVVDYSLIDSGVDGFTINATTRIAGDDWAIGASNSATATNIASDINSNVTGFTATAYNQYVKVVATDGYSFTTFSTDADSDEMTAEYHAADSSHNDHIQMIGEVDGIIIERNYFQGADPVAYGYGIKFDGTDASDTIHNGVVRNNIFEFNVGGGSYCILAEYADGAVIANNTILNPAVATGSLRYTGNGVGTYIIANNIMTGASDIYLNGISASNNIFANTDPWSGSNSLENQDFTNSPAGNNRYFVNYAGGNFTIYDSNSPQVNAGNSVYAPDDDYIGTSRPQGGYDDIGAHEYIESGSAPIGYKKTGYTPSAYGMGIQYSTYGAGVQ